jgi:N-methylhydantoinase B
MDPVVYQVVQSRLSGIVQEMQDSIFRTGYSTILRETQDGSCMLLDANGDVVGEHVVVPLHIASLPQIVRAIRRIFGDDLHPGDAFLTNHPYDGGVPHAMDMGVVTPMFHDGKLAAFCGSIAHKSDLGGVVAGTSYGSARELFQEGIQYPPVRYVSRGTIVRDIDAILRANSRTPELVLGDVRGQVGIARLGERRLAELFARYGAATVLEMFARKQDVTEARIRAELRRWPDGAFEAETFIDNDGVTLDRRIRYHVRVEKTGERILFDFRGCDDQAQGPVNIQPFIARGCCYYALIAMVDRTLPNDGGVARVVETLFRPGSVVSPHFPAPSSTYMATATAITEAMLQAISGFVSERRHAMNSGTGGMTISGTALDGRAFVQYESIASGYGGRAGGDGASGVALLLANTRAAPIEVLENEYPTRVQRFELIRDSGGAGEFRGGLTPRRTYEVLTTDAQLTLRGGRHAIAATGGEGGRPGRIGSCTVNPGTPREQRLPSRFSGVRLTRGDVVRIERAGAGGFGDPHRRPFERLRDDVLDGYVSRDAAVAEYGVDPQRLDAALTAWEPLPAGV